MPLSEEIRTVHLQHYAPNTVAPAKEFQGIYSTENEELNRVWAQAWRWLTNTFVYDLDEAGYERWETMLGIVPSVNATYDDRRSSILAKINNTTLLTERSLLQRLEAVFGVKTFVLELNYNEYSLKVFVPLDRSAAKELLRRYLRSVVPANLTIEAGFLGQYWQDIKDGTYNYGETIWLSYKNNWKNWTYIKFRNTLSED